jgi:hypothetical protein
VWEVTTRPGTMVKLRQRPAGGGECGGGHGYPRVAVA